MIDRIPLKNEPRLMEAVVQQMQVQLGHYNDLETDPKQNKTT